MEPSNVQSNLYHTNTETHKMKHPERGSQKSPPEVEETRQQEEIDDIAYLSGKPFFDAVLTKSNVTPHYNLLFPVRICNNLPRADVPAILRYNRKEWEMTYLGNFSWPRFDRNWKDFVMDNNLVVGDACVFEVMESNHTKIKFKVHVLKNEMPRGLLPEKGMDCCGTTGTAENPIDIVD